jgi:hypothetical protein
MRRGLIKLEKIGFFAISLTMEAVPKLQFLEQLLTPGENCESRNCLRYKELAIFSKACSKTNRVLEQAL